jgi:GNAT superfamily N-acetyltransferase
MSFTIRQTDTQNAPATLFSHKLTVKSRLVLAFEDERLIYSTIGVEPYEKEIVAQDTEYGFDDSEPVVFIAEEDGKPAGRIRMVSWWNNFAYVDDVTVNPEFRGRGIGRALLERGIQWARENNFPGVMLETQQDNVPACTLYQSCGFVLHGFDGGVYKAIKLPRPEVALYWYLLFE